jgi:undecaprenyl-diphosphatase
MTSEAPKAGRSLLLLAAASGGAALFALTAALVAHGDALAFDKEILLSLRRAGNSATPMGPDWLLAAARAVTELGGTPVLTLMVVVFGGYLILKRDGAALALLLAAALGQSIVVNLLKAVFGRDRPEIVPHLAEATSASFPSGHSASAAAIYLTLAALVARESKDRFVRNYAFFVAVALAIVVGASRVYLGVHYPTDVVGGLSFGAAWAAIVFIAARRLERPN